MRSIVMRAAAVLAVLVVPGAADAQRGGRGGQDFQRMLETNPVWELLDAKARLELTEGQVERLQAMARALDEANQPNLAKVREVRAQMPAPGSGPPSPEARAKMRAAMETARPAMQAIRQSHQNALREARALLTEPQQATLDRIVEEWRQERGRRGPPRG